MSRAEFVKDIKSVINAHSVENHSNTPDWILAEYLVNCLEAYEFAVSDRTAWHTTEETDVVPCTAVGSQKGSEELDEWRRHYDEDVPPYEPSSELTWENGSQWENGEIPPYEPSPGMRWTKEHYVCDQGHFGGFIWKQVKETPANTIMSLSDIDGSLR